MPTKSNYTNTLLLLSSFRNTWSHESSKSVHCFRLCFECVGGKNPSITVTFDGITDIRRRKNSPVNIRRFLIGLSSMQLFLVLPKLRKVGLEMSAAKVTINTILTIFNSDSIFRYKTVAYEYTEQNTDIKESKLLHSIELHQNSFLIWFYVFLFQIFFR